MSSDDGKLGQNEEAEKAEYEALYQGMLTELRGLEAVDLEMRRAIAEKTYIKRSVKHIEKIKELIGKCQSALSAIDELVNKCGPVGHREELKCRGDVRERILQKQEDTERLKNSYTKKLARFAQQDGEARDLLLQDQQHRQMLSDASPGKVGKVGKMRKSLETLAGRVDEKLFKPKGGGRKSRRRKYSKKRKSKRRKYSKRRKSSKRRKYSKKRK
jgi:hypothetical protein